MRGPGPRATGRVGQDPAPPADATAQGEVIQAEAAANIALGKCEDDQVAYDASQAAALKTRAAARRAQAQAQVAVSLAPFLQRTSGVMRQPMSRLPLQEERMRRPVGTRSIAQMDRLAASEAAIALSLARTWLSRITCPRRGSW